MPDYRVRFAPVRHPRTHHHLDAASDQAAAHPADQRLQRSRSGCSQCRSHKVKCDETFPVCVRCLKRGLLCRLSPRLQRWQVETRWVSSPLGTLVKPRLLQYWVERACQMLVIDPENNPYSFPILEYLTRAPSLVHMIQSLSAAHQEYFPANGPIMSLEERGRALQLLQRELTQTKHLEASFLTVQLLGLSQWADPDPRDFGQQHLFAARHILDHLLLNYWDDLAHPGSSELFSISVGSFLYWDMCCAHLVDAQEQLPLDTTLMAQAVHTLRNKDHPVYGPAAELIYLLAQVGRYCRSDIQLGRHSDATARSLEQELRAFQAPQNNGSLALLHDSLQKHGLIILRRTHAIVSRRKLKDEENDELHSWAVGITQNLSQLPLTSTLLNIQSLPLLTAGSELRSSDTKLREIILTRFKAIYSMNRVPSTLQAMTLLKEVWAICDSGVQLSWIEYMILHKKWRLVLG